MRLQTSVAVLVAVAVLHCSGPASAQIYNELSWDISVEDAEYLGNPARTYRAYEETEHLQLRLLLMNRSQPALTIDQSSLQSMLEVRVAEASQEIPVTVEWLPEVQQPGDFTPHVQIGPMYLERHTGASWRVIVRRRDGEKFHTGQHVITFWMHGLRSAVRTTDDSAWTGQVFDGPGTVALIVDPATTAADLAKMHNMRGRDAMMRRDYLDALDAFALATAADPTNIQAKEWAGYAYMILRRYREAISRFEAVVLPFPKGYGPMRQSLASAYMAIGDEANAFRVIRESGAPEVWIASKFSELRRKN